jgi:hypothetical protein
MKATRLLHFITLLSITVAPFAQASGKLETGFKPLMDCPKQIWIEHGVRFVHVTYAGRTGLVSTETALQQARSDLAAFWARQLAETKYHVDVMAPVAMVNLARITAVTAGAQPGLD